MLPDDTLVRSNCPDCGTVELPATRVTVLVAGDGARPRYRFTCPACTRVVEKITSARAAAMLDSVGAHMLSVPASGPQAPRSAQAAPCTAGTSTRERAAAITAAEIRAFAKALDQVDDVASAAGGNQLF